MKQFVDTTGKTWTISINVGTIKRVRDLADVDLLDLKDGNVFERLSSDPVMLCDTLWELCANQADKDGVTKDQFFDSMAGDVIDSATMAMLDELVAFFPNAKRALLENLLRKLRTVQTAALNHAGKMLEQIDVEKIMEASLSGSPSTNSPESSDSIPTA